MDEEDINASKRRKIEDEVLQILRSSDLETATEFSVRAAAEQRLGLDLSGLSVRRLVHQIIDSFLLSTAAAAVDTPSPRTINNLNNTENGDYNGKIICKLSGKRMVTVHDMCGTTMVAIRDFGFKDGQCMRPRIGENTGLSLTPSQWSSFKNNIPSIQAAIVKMESRLRSEVNAKQSEANITKASSAEKIQKESDISHQPIKTVQIETEIQTTNQDSNSDPQEQIPTERNQNKADVSELTPSFPDQPNADISQQLLPIKAIKPIRLDGRNYYSWRHQMELSLNQLNIAYVLFEPCPTIPSTPETSSDMNAKIKASIEKWVKDDYMCHLTISNSLCDNLFEIYSAKSCSARDLWEELKSAYNEDFGTKRSLINKYIKFEMAEGVSIPDQAQELGKIADSIIASGTWIDESFHVGVVVSKLPNSWKEVRVRLLREEFLTLNMLTQRIRVEEESRRNKMEGKVISKSIFPKVLEGSRYKVNKRVCYVCGKEGHISVNCPGRKSNEAGNMK